MLAPVSGVITTGMQVAADRYGYLTMIVFVAPVAGGLCDLVPLLSRMRRPVLTQALGAGVLIAGLASLTYIQCRTWKDSEAPLVQRNRARRRPRRRPSQQSRGCLGLEGAFRPGDLCLQRSAPPQARASRGPRQPEQGHRRSSEAAGGHVEIEAPIESLTQANKSPSGEAPAALGARRSSPDDQTARVNPSLWSASPESSRILPSRTSSADPPGGRSRTRTSRHQTCRSPWTCSPWRRRVLRRS